MLSKMIRFSLNNKLIIFLFTLLVVVTGIYSLFNLSFGTVPDVTNNQVQVITTTRNLSTQDVEQFITYPIELEIANLPGVEEIRSVSKFGLSVVTIVFEDGMGTYLPRQLIAEKLDLASANIPAEFGKPTMGPISTGLGEIYQYILEVDTAYKQEYSVMELRSIQDWVVRRQLLGIPGVVEVNTWGGYLKQYEVAIDPMKLRSLNLSISSVYEALEMNNSVAGGGYIEKGKYAYFIRGEGLSKNIEDIENTVLKNDRGVPVYIKDVAQVQFGYATRFGAITANGEGEKVLGQVMMLKDANPKEVIEKVKQRVEEIKPSLPPGIRINPFLERSELIDKTSSTILENLILGCLIVIFVVVLLLGNWRAGLVVASIIPLSLLFAISLMYFFDVDANLMSLGAIDFGIIIDAAVIIVEFVAFGITKSQKDLIALSGSERRLRIDEITFNSTNKMMRSAIFGQLIIIIVLVPILLLSNVEGKMFRPMAATLAFALLGTMLFCFTYVPVISSLVLRPTSSGSLNFSNRLILRLKNNYERLLNWAIGKPRLMITSAVVLFVFALSIFLRMGGEFAPKLDEGDFVIQPVLKTGTSLSQTIATTTEIEKVLKTFPEVDQVVTRIGAAEIPTDPMSMEETDVIITLLPKSEWKTAQSKDALAQKMKDELLRNIAGVDYEFTQPIEMRFNELITGVRADLAIKIFGEDLSVLNDKAQEIARVISEVDGAADITVEKTAGLPQMLVSYNRRRIAQFGVTIKQVNEVLGVAFAGKVAGGIYEGEKRFDLVVRYDSSYRKGIQNIENLLVTGKNGLQIPLEELAEITFEKGPAKISRENTHRRTVVNVNVRGRDLESVVLDIQQLINEQVAFPAGYQVTYGGQFENLQSATKHLIYAVPLALLLILILLYFAFRSIKEALLVYSTIPLAAVGGVILLWVRDMPFSISAGVGFIALFGIAVLNGIVLISEYKELFNTHKNFSIPLIIRGSVSRLRPVLLTASAAALGFLPMAISHSTGAEVQRPLATVVIGGLISSTLLTLFVLPILYTLLAKSRSWKPTVLKGAGVVLMLFALNGNAQTPVYTLQDAISIAKQNNNLLKSKQKAVERQSTLKAAGFEMDKTQVYYNFDENNITPMNAPLRVWGIQQSFRFPTAYRSEAKLNKEQVQLRKRAYVLEEWKVEEQVSKAVYRIHYHSALKAKYEYLDSAYRGISRAAMRRYELGETNGIEHLTAISKQNEIGNRLKQVENDLQIAYNELDSWLQIDSHYVLNINDLKKVEVDLKDTVSPMQQYLGQQAKVIAQQEATQKNNWLPDLHLEYFRGNSPMATDKAYNGVQVGLGIPLFYGSQRSKVRALQLEGEQFKLVKQDFQKHLQARRQEYLLELTQLDRMLGYYDKTGKELSNELMHMAQQSYASGAIDYFQFLQTVERSVKIHEQYLIQLWKYNDTALSLKYLIQ